VLFDYKLIEKDESAGASEPETPIIQCRRPARGSAYRETSTAEDGSLVIAPRPAGGLRRY
jgi:hypothetical protein